MIVDVLGDPSTATAAVEDDDDPPATGSVTVTTATTFTEGETLTADTSGLTDGDGLDAAVWVYQWVRAPSGDSDEDISGATGAACVPVFADAGATLKVKVTVTDDEGHEAEFESAATSAVAALPRPSVTVVSDGDLTEGSAAVFTLTRTGDRLDLLRPASSASSVIESGFSRAIVARSSRLRPESTFAKLSVDVNHTVGSPPAGLCSPRAIASVRALIRSWADRNRVRDNRRVIPFSAMTGPRPSATAADPRTVRLALELLEPTAGYRRRCRNVIAENARKRGQAWSVCTPCIRPSRTMPTSSQALRRSSDDVRCAGPTSRTCEQAPGLGDACRNVLSRLLRSRRRPVP